VIDSTHHIFQFSNMKQYTRTKTQQCNNSAFNYQCT